MKYAIASRAVSPNDLVRESKQRCKLCGGQAVYKFSLPLIQGLQGNYSECQNCQFLQSSHLDDQSPEEIEQLYALESSNKFDSGAAWRQACIVNRIVQLVRLKLITSGPGQFKLLDFGCGSGFVASNLAHQFGWQVVAYDQYTKPTFPVRRVLQDWAGVVSHSPYNLIVASEVFEHFLSPQEQITQLRDVLSEDYGFVFVTTGLYIPGVRDQHWEYLAPEAGQHVAFYSRKAIDEVRRLLRANEVYQVGAEYEWLFVKRAKSSSWRQQLRYRAAATLLRTAVSCGLLQKIA